MNNDIERIIEMYRQATVGELDEGLNWYRIAYLAGAGIAARHNRSIESVIGIIAALSPMCQWSQNLINADRFVAEYRQGKSVDEIRIQTTSHRRKAYDICAGDLPEYVLGGDKVRSFYDNILNHETSEEVTVDRHAYRIWCGRDDVSQVPKKLYARIANDYREAALVLGVLPHQVQAVTWVVYRRLRGIA